MESVSTAGRPDRRWVVHVLIAMVVVALACSGGIAGVVYLNRTPPPPPAKDPFWTPDLTRAAAPFRPHLGACKLVEHRQGSVTTVTTCEPGAGAPGKVVFTRYRRNDGADADRMPEAHAMVAGPRNGGRIWVGNAGITWRDGAGRLSVRIGAGHDWHAGRLLRWWDEATAGSSLSGPTGSSGAGGSAGSPVAGGSAVSGPAASAPAVPPGAGAPPAVAEMSYLLQLFARPWWREIQRCAAAPEYRLIPPLPLIDRFADIYAVCTLAGDWRRAGGFGEIIFVAWENLGTAEVVHKMLGDAFGAEQLRDLPGDSGPRSGRFLLTQVRSLNTCFLYWDDAAMAVAAIVDATCPTGGRPSAASVQAFWDARV